jgi:hypothetical protein
MKRIYELLSVLLLMLLIASCNKDFLETTPKDQFSDASVWKDKELIKAYTNRIYQGLHYPLATLYLSSFVDETAAQGFYDGANINQSLISPSGLSIFDASHWSSVFNSIAYENAYKTIRACNVFFEKIDNLTFAEQGYNSQDEKDQKIGEVIFCRAYLYHWLVSMYGGVPLITKSYNLSDDFNIARNTYEECINFIMSECDKAAELLQNGGDKFRATKGAALALKARTLLYAASDFANSGGSWAGSYPNKDLVSYNGGDRTARWQKAKDAAKAVIDLGVNSLYKAEPASAAEATKNYADYFVNGTSDEDIFLLGYDNINGSWPYTYWMKFMPNGWDGWAVHAPVNQLVDSYEMVDGSKFNWLDPKHKAAPYKDRDPRFYASILFDGAYWGPRISSQQGIDPSGNVQIALFEQADGSFKGGLDTKDGPSQPQNAMPEGYFQRKFADPTKSIQARDQKNTPWRPLRFGEVLLNYAEACIELGNDVEAKLYLNKIRKRAGMPDITSTGSSLKDEYRNERKIEMAFEEQRFFDVRRWMIAPWVYTPAKGVTVKRMLNGTVTYEVNPELLEPREFKNNWYLFPFSITEVSKNSKLVQNPLY